MLLERWVKASSQYGVEVKYSSDLAGITLSIRKGRVGRPAFPEFGQESA
jgi:hypothetical protein